MVGMLNWRDKGVSSGGVVFPSSCAAATASQKSSTSSSSVTLLSAILEARALALLKGSTSLPPIEQDPQWSHIAANKKTVTMSNGRKSVVVSARWAMMSFRLPPSKVSPETPLPSGSIGLRSDPHLSEGRCESRPCLRVAEEQESVLRGSHKLREYSKAGVRFAEDAKGVLEQAVAVEPYKKSVSSCSTAGETATPSSSEEMDNVIKTSVRRKHRRRRRKAQASKIQA